MAEEQFQITRDGSEVETDDLNLVSTNGALADDRVLAELLRTAPYNGTSPARGIVPSTGSWVVKGNGATGSVLVMPFRAVIGSRSAIAGTDGLANYRELRSGIFAVSSGGANLGQALALAANSSGHARWDLVYAAVVPDADGEVVNRYVKDPDSGVPSVQTVVRTKRTTVTAVVLGGTPGTSPALPTIPADASGQFNIPIAYVRVPNGFGASSTVSHYDVLGAAPILQVHPAAGGSTVRPMQALYSAPDGTNGLNATLLASWANSSLHPGWHLPPEMSGGTESLLVLLDMRDADPGNWAVQDGGVLDKSRDWRRRFFRYQAHLIPSANEFACSQSAVPGHTAPEGDWNTQSGPLLAFSGMGQSFVADSTTVSDMSAPNQCTIMTTDHATNSTLALDAAFAICVNPSDGSLVFRGNSFSGELLAFIWLDATQQYANAT